MPDRRPYVIEIAKTENGLTHAEAHLRYLTGGLTLCGIRIDHRRSEPSVWFPVAEDEAGHFIACGGCDRRASAFHVVSRPAHSTRPESSEADMSELIGLTPGNARTYTLAQAICQTLYTSLDGETIVPESIFADIDLALDMIVQATVGNGIAGGLSAIDAANRMERIREMVSGLRYRLRAYTPQRQGPSLDASTASETDETPQTT